MKQIIESSLQQSLQQTEKVTFNGQLLAIIIRHNFFHQGIHFLTSDQLSQQVGYIHYPVGKVIQPHIHHESPRLINSSTEVLIIKQGKLLVDFYTQEQEYISYYILEKNDVIILIAGGHGFKVLEEVEMIEVKQGPYQGKQEKTRFTPS